jgi:hypothetical protein
MIASFIEKYAFIKEFLYFLKEMLPAMAFLFGVYQFTKTFKPIIEVDCWFEFSEGSQISVSIENRGLGPANLRKIRIRLPKSSETYNLTNKADLARFKVYLKSVNAKISTGRLPKNFSVLPKEQSMTILSASGLSREEFEKCKAEIEDATLKITYETIYGFSIFRIWRLT